MFILVAFLGAAIGSFLGVVVDRYNTGLGLGGRSICFNCHRMLRWYELVPIFSFVLSGRKCRQCGVRLSWDYLAIELVTAGIFVLAWLRHGLSIEFFIVVILASVFVILSFYDARHKILPDLFVAMVGLVGVFLIIFGFDMGQALHWYGYFLYGVAAALPFALLWFFSKGRLMGFGDVKLIFVLGLLLGKLVVTMLLLAFWSGAVIGIGLLIFEKIRSKLTSRQVLQRQIPFGPFLLLSAFIILVYGSVLTQLWPIYFSWLV